MCIGRMESNFNYTKKINLLSFNNTCISQDSTVGNRNHSIQLKQKKSIHENPIAISYLKFLYQKIE